MRREFALPGTPSQYAPDRRFDIQHYKIALELDVANRRIEGTCSLTLTPLADGQQWVQLDAVELEISRVKWYGRDLEYSHNGKHLRIDLGKHAKTGDTIQLDVSYSGHPRRGLYFVGPDKAYPDKPVQVWSQGQDQDSRYWFPCFDSPHEKATSEIVATVPGGWFALSNGNLAERREDKNKNTVTYHWQFDTPHSCYLITLAAGELTELTDSWEDVAVTYYVQPGLETECKRTLARTPEMLALFSEKFGVRYPYDKYAQVFVADFIFGGMENTTATTLTDVVLLDERAALDYDLEALVAHELAHQWFGDLLTCRDWGQGWLNEGFATYSEYIWRDHAEGRDAAALELDEWGEQYYGEDSNRYRRMVATNVYDEPIDIFDHHLYEKGGRVLHMLRQVLGDDAFWRSISHYLRKHRAGSVETRDLARAVEEATGRVLDWFFDQWILKGAGHPELEIAFEWEQDRNLAKLTIKQTQKVEGDTPLFRLPVQVRFRVGKSKKDHDFDIEITEQQQTFFFPLEREPTLAIFDPGKHVLAQVKLDKGQPLWINQLREATEGIDRIHAARRLATMGGKQAEDALIEALGSDEFWGVRSAAAAAHGKLRTPSARDALIKAIRKTKHPKARRGVVRALGEFRYDETAGEALAGVAEGGDASYFVEAEACLALGKTRSERAPEVLRSALERDSFIDTIRQHAYRGLAEARDHAAIPMLLAGTSYGKVPHGRRAALGALATLARGRRDAESTQVRERAEELLRDPDFRMQSAAIEALGTIADPAAIPTLRDTVERELDGRLRRRSREVIRDITEARATNEKLETLTTEVEKLRTELLALRARLDEPGGKTPTKKRKAPARKKAPAKRKTAAKKKTSAKPTTRRAKRKRS